MTQPSPADELRAAAAGLRLIEDDLPGWLHPLGEPLAQWLDFEAHLIDRLPGAELRGRTERALAVARALTGSQP